MNITELRTKSLKLAHDGADLLKTIKDDGSNEAEVTAQFDNMMKESDGLAERAARLDAVEARNRSFGEIVTDIPETGTTVRHANDTDEKREAAFNSYIRGEKSLSEIRAMGVATDPKGGALVPNGFISKLITRLRTEGPMLDPSLVTYLSTASGNPIEMPTFDDDKRAVIIGENTLIPEDDLAFNSKTLGAYKYTSKLVRVSNELLQDAAIPVDDTISGALARRIGRGLNEDLTTGTGVNMPEGIVTAASSMTAALATAFSVEELFALQHAIDPAYRRTGTWMFNDAVLLKARTMKDTTGAFIWQPGMSVDAPQTILGRPFVINPYMDSAFSTGKTVALFGDLKAYTVRQVRDIYVRRLEERYADYDQVGFVALARFDGKLLDNGAIKALKLA